MYTPRHFEVDDIPAMHAMMRRHPFALLATHHSGELHLTHLPFHLDPSGRYGILEAHLARANPHCAALRAGAESVVVFKGPHGYVSPRWYQDPAKNVPTWNYVAVHAHGRPATTEDPAAVLGYIGRLTDEHEAYIDRPWSVGEARDYAGKLVSQVLAFRIPIERLEGKFKLSQNRPPVDRAGVMRELKQSPGDSQREMLELMEKLYTPDGESR